MGCTSFCVKQQYENVAVSRYFCIIMIKLLISTMAHQLSKKSLLCSSLIVIFYRLFKLQCFSIQLSWYEFRYLIYDLWSRYFLAMISNFPEQSDVSDWRYEIWARNSKMECLKGNIIHIIFLTEVQHFIDSPTCIIILTQLK